MRCAHKRQKSSLNNITIHRKHNLNNITKPVRNTSANSANYAKPSEESRMAQRNGNALNLVHVLVVRYEPRHDKTNKMSVRPAKTQISLDIRPVWAESSLSAWGKLGSLADAQADLSLRWAHTHFICFVMSRLICVISAFFSVFPDIK